MKWAFIKWTIINLFTENNIPANKISVHKLLLFPENLNQNNIVII